MNRKKKFSLENVSDFLSDSEMKHVKGGDPPFGFILPPDVYNCCEPGDPMVECMNGYGDRFRCCNCLSCVYASIGFEQCYAITLNEIACNYVCMGSYGQY